MKLKSIRETFLPDENCVFVRCDLQQAEHRMGLMYCGTPRMLIHVNTNSADHDAFTNEIEPIFGINPKTIDKAKFKQMRYLTKKIFHASWRNMAGDKMSESVSRDTDGKLFIPPKECQRLINIYLDKNPEISNIYMPWVRQQIRDTGILKTTWGRRLDLRRKRIDDDLYRIGYSFYLQAEVADWTNQYGFIPATYYMLEKYNRPANAQVHDEVIASVPIWEAYEYAMFITLAMQQRREIPVGSGNYLTIPAGTTIGRSWGDQKGIEFKRMPSRDEFYNKLAVGGFEL